MIEWVGKWVIKAGMGRGSGTSAAGGQAFQSCQTGGCWVEGWVRMIDGTRIRRGPMLTHSQGSEWGNRPLQPHYDRIANQSATMNLVVRRRWTGLVPD